MGFSRREENLIAEFRSLPLNYSRAIIRKERSIETILCEQLKKLPINKKRPEEVIMSNWKDIVGNFIAHRCYPSKIVDGKKLIIQVGNATLRQELNFQRQKILMNIQQLPLCENICEIMISGA